MPVPTETYWNIRRLNLVFAASALALLAATGWLVMADYNRQWRTYQREAIVWQVAMTEDAQRQADYRQQAKHVDDLQDQLDQLDAQLAVTVFDELGERTIAQAEAGINEKQQELAKLRLPNATVKGEIGPLTQQIERASLTHGEDSDEVTELRAKLAEFSAKYEAGAATIVNLEQDVAELTNKVAQVRSKLANLQRARDNAARSLTTIEERLAKLDPKGSAKLGKIVRDAPLLDWFNPSEKVQQVVVPQIRTDLNFLDVETIDRCNSCHINIEDPAFEQSNLMLFVERQVASEEGQDVDTVNRPVVMVDFWRQAADGIGGVTARRIAEVEQRALKDINRLRERMEQPPLESADQLPAELERIAYLRDFVDSPVRRREWYEPLTYYVDDLRQTIRDSVGEEQYRQLADLYREVLTQQYNRHRAEDGLPELDTSPVLLGHPRLDLFAGSDSPHPIKTMGCTSCHEGSGQETQFEHTSHMPRNMWVDADTGAPVPEFLVEAASERGRIARPSEHDDNTSGGGHAGFSLDGATHAYASAPEHDDAPSTRYTHTDIKLTDTANPAPFAPTYEPASHRVPYMNPNQPGVTGTAVRQADYWEEKYGWHAVHYMHWEKPMHRLEFIESSCNKCHTEIFDIQDEAPQLFAGRKLFAQLGCANCHTVESLQDDLDVKKVGPSLVHVKHKLSASMMASWIWSPKSFRPLARMPHYFMLENNSSPVDILRTRTEVSAMTHYLLKTESSVASAYAPEPPPDEQGNAASGRALFNSLGCLSCHANLTETGEEWIAEDLVERTGLPAEQAKQRAAAMPYNEQHWYALEHLSDRLERTGPELSGVGTKLKEGRTDSEARAWVYDWIRNPRHYSSYTIMPSFRLSPQEASDMAAYLLSLERPGYQADTFGFDAGGQPNLDDQSKQMLAELVAQLNTGQGTLAMAREHVEQHMSVDEQLNYLGKKMISHYGCNSCHLINGFEEAAATCATLDDWGLKDPHKLDFGYFEHAFDADRAHPIEVWKVKHEGLAPNAPGIDADSADQIERVQVKWEQMDNERRPWLYHKLHNPRVYDRARAAFEGALSKDGKFDMADDDVGRPYDKLKMPKFFMDDEQAKALVTYVTSIRKPLVSSAMQDAAMDQVDMRLVRGRQVATLYNCYGCHNVEGNDPAIWEYLSVRTPEGAFDYDVLNNAPPRLISQGAKTQPDWLFSFLHDVHPLRPWLKIRMPSFPLDGQEATGLVEYFAAASQDTARRLDGWIVQVDEHRKTSPDDADWFDSPRLAHPIKHLTAFAIGTDLVRPSAIDPRSATPDERRAAWNTLIESIRFTRQVNNIDYPFNQAPSANTDPEWFARGEALFNELRCYQCHAMGDEEKLLAIWNLDNPDTEDDIDFDDAEEDGYDEYGDEEDGYSDDDGYGDDEGYGDEEEQAIPAGPVYSAPNLGYTARRLQWKWVDEWLQEPATIQPGTKMPQWFPGGTSAFSKYPGSVKDQMHGMYGYIGKDQRKLLLDYVYEAGRRNYTPGAERLAGGEPEKIELKPMAPPPAAEIAEKVDGKSAGASGGDTAPPKEVTPPPAATPTPAPQPTVSQITDFHDDATSSYAGGGKGRVIGQVTFDGKPPKREPVRMSSDRTCAKAHKGKRLFNEKTIVNKDSTVQNVFIHVTAGLPSGVNFPTPTEAAVIDQSGCLYIPHVRGLVAGQPLKILNSDATLHNVKMTSMNNGSFNEGMPVKDMVLDKVLSKPELGIPLKCDVHPWMSGFLYVVDHPFFSVTDVQGRFEIVGLPPGTYTLEAVHENEKIPSVTFEVTVQADTSTRADMVIGLK